jgi:hypothetical protein
MTIKDLLALAEARLLHLSIQRENAVRTGDVQQLMVIDSSILETETTIFKLRLLLE